MQRSNTSDIAGLMETPRKSSTASDSANMLQLDSRIGTVHDWPNLRGTHPLYIIRLNSLDNTTGNRA